MANKQILLDAKKLIIPIRLGIEDTEYMGLYIGLHLRLTRELEDVRFLPIFFISEDSKEEILSNQIKNYKEKSGLLLFTQGSYLLSSFYLEEYLKKSILPIDEHTLIQTVIPVFNIENTKDLGHQLANEWGALRLAKFAGYSLVLEKPTTSLYFKFKNSLTSNEVVPNKNNIIGLLNESCKAILIDDNADFGWSEIVYHILRTRVVNLGKPVSCNVIMTFEEAIKYTDYLNYDIVFLDLRLLKEEDKANRINSIDEFTGVKLLKIIKEINKGIQIIIFTASNKVWNIEKLIDMGANGYYIKESPEYVLSSDFSKDNYDELIKTIQSCLSRKPLKNIYSYTQQIKINIESLIKNSKIRKDFGESVLKYIGLANKIIDLAKIDDDYAMGYITLFKCIELINDDYILKDDESNWTINGCGALTQFKYKEKHNKVYNAVPISFYNNPPSTFEKIAAISSQILGFKDAEILDFYHNVQRRNKFIHADDHKSLTKTQLDENIKIFGYEGYIKLIASLDLFFCKLELKYI